MQSITVIEAKARFSEVIDLAQHEPVQVLRRGSVVAVMVSAQDYEDMRRFYANRLQLTLDTVGIEAAANGLREADVDQLLADGR